MKENKMAEAMRYMRYLIVISAIVGVFFSRNKSGLFVQVLLMAFTAYALYLIRGDHLRFNKAFTLSAIIVLVNLYLALAYRPTFDWNNMSAAIGSGKSTVIEGIASIVVLVVTLMREKNLFYGIMAYNESQGYQHPKIASESKRLWKLTYAPFFAAIIYLIVILVMIGVAVGDTSRGSASALIAMVIIGAIAAVAYIIYMTVMKYKYFHLCELTFEHPPMADGGSPRETVDPPQTEVRVEGTASPDEEPKNIDDFY